MRKSFTTRTRRGIHRRAKTGNKPGSRYGVTETTAIEWLLAWTPVRETKI